MHLRRKRTDYRVSERLRDSVAEVGDWALLRVVRQGMRTVEVQAHLAELLKLDGKQVSFASEIGRETVAAQHFVAPIESAIEHQEANLRVRTIGRWARPLVAEDCAAHSFDLWLRGLQGEEMRRIRVHIDRLRESGLVNYFDEESFACLRHGQGFVMRKLLQGKPEAALKDLLTSPSPFGPRPVEAYKAELREKWGRWPELARLSAGHYGSEVFQWLLDHRGDFEGAWSHAVSPEERSSHLQSWRTHLANRAAVLWMRQAFAAESLAWIPGEDGPLAVPLQVEREERARLAQQRIPLPLSLTELDSEWRRCYDAVLRAEGLAESALAPNLWTDVDLAPQSRALHVQPTYLRAAPAVRDELDPRKQKMQLLFQLPPGVEGTVLVKGLILPTDAQGTPPRLRVGRRWLDFPGPDGNPAPPEASRPPRGARSAERRPHQRRGPAADSSPRNRRGPRGGGPKPNRGVKQ